MRINPKIKTIKIGILVFILIIIFTLLKIHNEKTNEIDSSTQNEIQNVEIPIKENLNVVDIKKFDLEQELTLEYESIKCRKSKEIVVSTTLCVHDLTKDSYVSSSIWQNGVWEADIVTHVIDYLNKNPDWLFLDIGAQIGQYSLFAAKLGRKVLSVEPFHDNFIRLHKAAKNESFGDRITLITNAITNIRGEIKLLKPEEKNIGGQSLIQNKNKVIHKNDIKIDDPNFKYYVETIIFDDIVPYLPKKDDGTKYQKALMKIDIEAFEPYAFQHASKLFDAIDIPIIFMEWGNLPQQHDMVKEIEDMIEFLYSRDLVPYVDNKVLNRTMWQTGWGWDIVWRKSGN